MQLPTNRISYLDIGFDFSRLPHRYLPLLDLFGAGHYRNRHRKTQLCSVRQGSRYLQRADFSHAINTYAEKTAPDNVRLILWIGLKALPEYLEQAIDLLAGPLFRSLLQRQD